MMYSILVVILCVHVFGLKNDANFINEKSLQVKCTQELRALLSLARMAKSNKMSSSYHTSNQKKDVPSKLNQVSWKLE